MGEKGNTGMEWRGVECDGRGDAASDDGEKTCSLGARRTDVNFPTNSNVGRRESGEFIRGLGHINLIARVSSSFS